MAALDARLRAGAARYGERAFALRAAALIDSGVEDEEFLGYVGLGSSMPSYLARSWGARALEHYWSEDAAASVIRGLRDEHWRVRMVCARVCGKRELGVPEQLARLCADSNWRVRAAAAHALGVVGEGEHAGALQLLLADENAAVQDAAARGLTTLAERLDRTFD